MSAVLIPKQQQPAPLPRIELRSTREGWEVALINHKGIEECERLETKHEAIAAAVKLHRFLDWPIKRVVL